MTTTHLQMFSAMRPRRLGKGMAGYLFVAPALAFACCLVLLPLVAVLIFSFTDYTLAAVDFSFVGLENYASALIEPGLRNALTNTLLYVGIVVPCSVALGLLIALLVHHRRRSRRFYEIAFFLPVTSTMVAMAVVWQYLLHGRIGPINALLSALGLERIDFLTDPSTALYAIAAIGVWQLTGFAMVLFLAGLTAIPRGVYEAASIDGADGGFDRFWRITLPLLGPSMLFVTITCSITAFQVFDTVAVLTKGGPMKSTEVLLYTVYLEGFQYFEIGRASALIAVFLAFILLFSLLQILVAERRTFYGG